MLMPFLALANILLTSDHQKIAYEHYCNNHSKVIIIANGFFNSKDAALLKDLKDSLIGDYDVLMFDFRGHGKSSGLFTWTSKESLDLEAVLDYAQEQYEQIGIIAFSLGASTSINVLSKRDKVNSLICISTPCEVEKLDYRFWDLDLENDILYNFFTWQGLKGRGARPGPFWLKKEKPLENIAKIKIPVLYIHGDKDWVVKPRHSELLYNNTTSKKKLVIIKNGPHAEHLLRKFSKEIIAEVKEWFGQTLDTKISDL